MIVYILSSHLTKIMSLKDYDFVKEYDDKMQSYFWNTIVEKHRSYKEQVFFPSNLWGRWIGDCPCHTRGLNQIRLQIKEEIKDFWNLVMFVWHARTYNLNLGIAKKIRETWWLWINFPKRYICIQFTILFVTKWQKNCIIKDYSMGNQHNEHKEHDWIVICFCQFIANRTKLIHWISHLV
jgi:hypothetical protein